MSWHPQAYEPLLEGNYQQVAYFYEQLLENEPETLSHYWYLGLAYLLQEQEEEAQMTWLFPVSQGTPEEVEQWSQDLIKILDTEAHRQQEKQSLQLGWLIRGHIREIDSSFLNNLLHLINLDIKLNQFNPESLEEWQVINLLKESPPGSVNLDLLLQTLSEILLQPYLQTVAFAEACFYQVAEPDTLLKIILPVAYSMGYQGQRPSFSADLTKVCLQFQPDNLALLDQLYGLYVASKQNSQALAVAQQFDERVHSLDLKVYANYKILSILIRDGAWQNLGEIAQHHQMLLQKLIDNPPESIEPLVSDCLQGITTPLLYLQDKPAENRYFINHISALFQKNIENRLKTALKHPTSIKEEQTRPLNIGYIGHTLRKHSVGWLSRWLFHYHDRENFKIALYLVQQPEDELTKRWFRGNADLVYNFQADPQAIAEQIQQDQIDILVDLESLTNNVTCQVMALKPAPIQVTWLGLDASGIPGIDYYMADPYVLPEDAQSYYRERIWRLPNTYVAVDGFEVAVPTRQRQQLDIPDEAVIYFSGQTGMKRHPDTIRLQMQILKAVPNSYLLIKGLGDEQIIQQLFIQLAEEQEVSADRLRFLSKDVNEQTHRANLQIADVVLDTYPYNGATTTLEVLWMGIPLVTRVGQQFAARNSYTFMINAGVEEGIAWSDEEYIEWGIRLGTDEGLRQQIFSKLLEGRKTAPLWNAQQFTREMEKAYQQMFKLRS